MKAFLSSSKSNPLGNSQKRKERRDKDLLLFSLNHCVKKTNNSTLTWTTGSGQERGWRQPGGGQQSKQLVFGSRESTCMSLHWPKTPLRLLRPSPEYQAFECVSAHWLDGVFFQVFPSVSHLVSARVSPINDTLPGYTTKSSQLEIICMTVQLLSESHIAKDLKRLCATSGQTTLTNSFWLDTAGTDQPKTSRHPLVLSLPWLGVVSS